MARREAATLPFVADYRIVETVDGNTDWAGTYHATFCARGNRRVWRGVTHQLKSAAADRFRRGLFVTRKEARWRNRRGFVHAWEDPDRSFGKWRGIVTDENPALDLDLPLDFGLEYATWPMSRYVRHASARVLREERVGPWDCVVVVVDWLDGGAATIDSPLMLWLAPGEGYFPVRTVAYSPSGHPDLVREEAFELEGRSFTPNRWYEVEELERRGEARVVRTGRRLPCGNMEALRAFHLEALRLGRNVSSSDVTPPAFVYLRHERTRVRYWTTPLGWMPLTWFWIAIYLVMLYLTSRGVWWCARRLRRWRSADSAPSKRSSLPARA